MCWWALSGGFNRCPSGHYSPHCRALRVHKKERALLLLLLTALLLLLALALVTAFARGYCYCLVLAGFILVRVLLVVAQTLGSHVMHEGSSSPYLQR